MLKSKKPTYPIPVPDGMALPIREPLFQGDTNACTVFSTVYGIHVQDPLQISTLDPLELYKEFVKSKYIEYSPRISVSYPDLFKFMGVTWREIPTTLESLKITLAQGHPVYTTINSDKQTHAICLVGYEGDIFTYHDSKSRKTPLKDLETLEFLDRSYVLFV